MSKTLPSLYPYSFNIIHSFYREKIYIQFIEQFRQAADHPVIATYPEGLYLKGFACRIM